MNIAVAVGLGLYVLALWALSWQSRTSSSLEYLLAGRRLTLWPFVATLVSTWYGGVLGVGEYSFRHGISNWLVMGVPYYLAAAVFALLLAARARRCAVLSIPEQLTASYGTNAGRTGAILVLLLAVPAAYALMMGELLQVIVGWQLGTAITVGVLFTIVIALSGGFRTVLAANALQFVLMYLGFLILLPIALAHTGGLSGLWAAVPPGHRTWDGGLGAQAVLVWYFIAMQTLVEPTFYQRCYAAQTPEVARRGVLISILFWVLFDFLTTFSGLAARVLLPNLDDPVLAYPALGRLVLSPAANAVFVVGLVATVMSTLHSYLFLAAATLSHDVAPELARRVDERRFTMLALGLTGLAATAMALAFRSVVAIWHDIGSIVTAALLLPLAASHAPERFRFEPRWATASLVVTAGVASSWLLARAPDGSYPLGLEPIFPALLVSALCWVGPRLAGWGSHRAGGPAPPAGAAR